MIFLEFFAKWNCLSCWHLYFCKIYFSVDALLFVILRTDTFISIKNIFQIEEKIILQWLLVKNISVTQRLSVSWCSGNLMKIQFYCDGDLCFKDWIRVDGSGWICGLQSPTNFTKWIKSSVFIRSGRISSVYIVGCGLWVVGCGLLLLVTLFLNLWILSVLECWSVFEYWCAVVLECVGVL